MQYTQSLLFTLLFAAFVIPASAQSFSSKPTEISLYKNHPGDDGLTDPKSPGRALAYSLVGTAVPVVGGVSFIALSSDENEPVGRRVGSGLFLGGWIVGPSLGHFYAEAPRRAWMGMGIRTAGSLVAILGQVWYHHRVPEEEREGASLLGIVGVVTIEASAAYDIYKAKESARKYNEAHSQQAQITPVVGPRAEQVGLALRARL